MAARCSKKQPKKQNDTRIYYLCLFSLSLSHTLSSFFFSYFKIYFIYFLNTLLSSCGGLGHVKKKSSNPPLAAPTSKRLLFYLLRGKISSFLLNILEALPGESSLCWRYRARTRCEFFSPFILVFGEMRV